MKTDFKAFWESCKIIDLTFICECILTYFAVVSSNIEHWILRLIFVCFYVFILRQNISMKAQIQMERKKQRNFLHPEANFVNAVKSWLRVQHYPGSVILNLCSATSRYWLHSRKESFRCKISFRILIKIESANALPSFRLHEKCGTSRQYPPWD